MFPNFIEIGSYLTDKEQKISWHSFLRYGVEQNQVQSRTFISYHSELSNLFWLQV